MRTRQLGKDGPEVPVICFGTWPLGGAFGAIEYDQAITTLRAAIDAGLTFLDTAESYFDSQAKIGEAIDGRRDEVFLATKVSGSDHSVAAHRVGPFREPPAPAHRLHRPVPDTQSAAAVAH